MAGGLASRSADRFRSDRFRTVGARWLTGALLALLLWPLAALGHSPPPAHGCNAPVRPVNDQDDRLWQRFLDDVDAFRACISNYAEENHRASDAHRQAANDATMDWNRFVRAELNVPEDYPWPPPEAQKR